MNTSATQRATNCDGMITILQEAPGFTKKKKNSEKVH